MNAYILCPPAFVTGGPQFCHQICNELKNYPSITPRILYINLSPREIDPKDYHPKVYEQRYHNDYLYTSLEDEKEIEEDSICFFPQTMVPLLFTNKFHKSKYKFVVWMSVNLYFQQVSPPTLNMFPQDVYHIVPSEYAKDYLINFAKVNKNKIFSIGDPPAEIFYNQITTLEEKKNIISFQPNKCLFINEVLNTLEKRGRTKDIILNPIEKQTTEQVIKNLKKSKVFLHLSYNPGLERVQQEAILLDNCVIQSTLGTAKYYYDCPIPNEYKFDLMENDIIEKIADKVEECIDNYDKCIDDFEFFKSVIWRRKQEFKEGIENIVKFIEEHEDIVRFIKEQENK